MCWFSQLLVGREERHKEDADKDPLSAVGLQAESPIFHRPQPLAELTPGAQPFAH
ncbi:MAG: Uncharacterised protein [Prochlorococcus marinus str. MIT 9313]|nr:MAG: Uncharacterised protein [Prochlorococcus marinus str. MIT 9313]